MKHLTPLLSLLASSVALAANASETNVQPLTEAHMLKYTQQAQKLSIGKKEVVHRKLNQGHKQLNSAMASPITQTISHPGASYIKLHFTDLDLTQGGKLVVASADGSESYEYTVENASTASFDLRLGDTENKQFSTMSVSSDTAVVTFYPGADQTSHFGEIDFYYHGNEGTVGDDTLINEDMSTFSTCGSMERQDVQCWAQSHPVEFDRSRPVARLLIAGSSLCTAWRVGPDNRMFTNNHCIESAQELTATEVWFNYQYTQCNGTTKETVVKVTGKDLLKTDYTLDYTLFTVNDFVKTAPFGYFGLDVRDPAQNERIYIPQHGSGNPKELSIESDKDSNGLCSVNEPTANGRGTGTDIGYYCDTIGGSSGSPVLSGDTNKVVALHHLGGCTNKGAKIKQIWPQVASHFNNQVPEGDNSTGTPPPVARFTYNCTALTCQFDGSGSTGNVQSHQWQFGDGQTAMGALQSHSYTTDAVYDVTLTVVDDKGKTSVNTQTVTVGQVSDEARLDKGVPKTGLEGSRGSELRYYIDVPAGANSVSVTTKGGTGDADLYVQFGAEPTTTIYDCRPYKSGNSESCSLTKGAGRYFVMIRGYTAFSGLELVADYQ
ncbi:pre-peptidase C-terminal domain-containing protein [Pseudoalteromonas xiamenensis]|uniref:pre-peptidase C-terminal domain-containing protein n=1 Tax=Pseudoalteromonas xiamenensis TaxID=882626 RepID=UPI0035E4D5CE